jgi:hypothetical protein
VPRVSTRTRKRVEVKRAMRCSAYPCKLAEERDGDAEIRVGDSYYTWARKNIGVYFQHVTCGYPRPTQLSSRKTAQVEEAIADAEKQIGDWAPEIGADFTYGDGYDDVTQALQSVADSAREVGQEYQDGFDNMPEGLNQGSTAQAMEEVAQELDGFADDLEQFSPNTDEPELPDRDDGEDDDDYRDRCQQALDDWADEVRSEATEKMSEMPEYNG